MKEQKNCNEYEFVGRKKTEEKKKRKIPGLLKIVLAEILCGAVVIAAFILIMLPAGGNPVLPDGEMAACLQAGQLSLTWSAPVHADVSRLYLYDSRTEEYVFYGEYEDNSAVISGVKENAELKIRLQAVRYTKNWFGRESERKSKMIERALVPVELQSPILHGVAHAEQKSLTIGWDTQSADACEIYALNENNRWGFLKKADGDMVEIRFGEELPLPGREQPAVFIVRALKQEEECVYYSEFSQMLKVERKELFGRDLALTWEQAEDGTYSLSWQETRGDTYEIQQWSEQTGIWIPKEVINWDSPLHYEIGKLPSGTQVRYRVLAHERIAETEEIVQKTTSSEVSFRAEISTLYCTIWPITELSFWPDAKSEEIIGSVPAGKALCVLDEENNRFKVFCNGTYGYIDARFCMIDLAEYLGDLCHYDITNSYESVFRVHGYKIPDITESVIPGFEHVCLGEGRFLVPFLYPCAQKLIIAAGKAEKDGYYLRIYEAFRPNEATKYLYSTMSALLDMPVPEEEEVIEQAAEEGPVEFTEPESEEAMAELLQEPVLTYRTVMTDNKYKLSAFLAQAVSAHNRGIALDLTLEKRDTGGMLQMQSDMHDLSWYSVLAQNNENANLLAKYMKEAGFNDLSSEWWHFQDDETREEIGLNVYLISGVSAAGWKKDDDGWRYRCDDGNYCRNENAMIEGETYTFSQEGYCMNFPDK